MVNLETGQQLTQRLGGVQQAKEEFWDRWVREVFPSLLKQQKRFKYKRDVKVGDIVPRKEETAAGQTYKYARVAKVHVGTDGKVRAADVEYKVPGEARFRMTTRPVHKLVLIIPVEEQVIKENEEKEKALESEPKKNQNKYEKKGKMEFCREESAVRVEQPEAGESGKEPPKNVQQEKMGPPTGARKCPLPTVVKIPEGEEEMVDVGATVKRKRGRPKKSDEMSPLDPHKGSVTDIGERVCVDPEKRKTILGTGGHGPPEKGRGQQLVPDSGGGET